MRSGDVGRGGAAYRQPAYRQPADRPITHRGGIVVAGLGFKSLAAPWRARGLRLLIRTSAGASETLRLDRGL
jgi:hypothetical protein